VRNPEFADRWLRGLMNAIATLQENPQRCGLAIEHEIFSEEVRQLLYGKAKNMYRILYFINILASVDGKMRPKWKFLKLWG
jgi:plasmid stabilization system protein ParE